MVAVVCGLAFIALLIALIFLCVMYNRKPNIYHINEPAKQRKPSTAGPGTVETPNFVNPEPPQENAGPASGTPAAGGDGGVGVVAAGPGVVAQQEQTSYRDVHYPRTVSVMMGMNDNKPEA